MADTPSTSGRTRKIETGTRINVWGEDWNTNLDLLDDQIDGLTIVPVTGNVTLTSVNYTTDQARCLIQKFTGAGGFTVTIPPVRKRYIFWNACTAAVVVTAGSGSITVDPDAVVLGICDAVDVKTLGYNGLSLKDYIASVVIGTISGLPAVTDNEDKFMYTDGVSAYWKLPVVADISDYASDQLAKTAAATALSIAFSIAL